MDNVMRFLMKTIGGFFDWWKETTGLPTVMYFDKFSVNWSVVSFMGAVILAAVLLLPGGLIF